ncbi:translation elongation factor-like protein [Candidatus Woesearchaeota archaeon]|nr:MAG: translation elongation factor-like protein [Candidatus Woesearchaeota archaeon]
MAEKEIGKITHYFGKIGVGVVELSDVLKIGDKIHIKGATTDITQTVDSMQINKNPVEEAKAGDAIGMKTTDQVRPGDVVFKVEEE